MASCSATSGRVDGVTVEVGESQASSSSETSHACYKLQFSVSSLSLRTGLTTGIYNVRSYGSERYGWICLLQQVGTDRRTSSQVAIVVDFMTTALRNMLLQIPIVTTDTTTYKWVRVRHCSERWQNSPQQQLHSLSELLLWQLWVGNYWK